MSLNNIRDTFDYQEQASMAVLKMEQLGICRECINEYMDNDKILMSVYANKVLNAILQEPDEKLMKRVKDWEKRTGNIVYHLQKSNTEFGEMISYLFISHNSDDWEDDVVKTKDNKGDEYFNVFAYVENESHPEWSEYGSIGLKPSMGGIVRVY